MLLKLRVPYFQGHFLAQLCFCPLSVSIAFFELFLFLSFFLSVHPASRIAFLCCAILCRSLFAREVKHGTFSAMNMRPVNLFVFLAASAAASKPVLHSLHTFTGLATFNDFRRQGNTNCGPKSGMTSSPSPPTTLSSVDELNTILR